ncbi:bifunctional 4-hydroxy-2-oxoglutarate aldolase/2-dehydro-3-deoxy-phosphogluconate aldolase [Candidatus Solirubrobacter pratensis]|uniref:bifunctional 4-hydroxy-2-oxoglutarate aldolase/2-dehydro-3-deoxy-phosphogluconate aldolase n=1 Tax=Candidatus Solirubrobacter pratensis TaxID=1298857 RepID=UPI0003FC365D|nr:bifunctional 4-hydroxy-2-oxoglutarate aldolase/2-dehydro-3-deoxy-phosphogluconate aldolase [Candidatus Solirubrobacter pratensis]
MKALGESGVVAILRLRDHGLAVEVAEALARGGIGVLELTQDDPAALAALRRVAALKGVVVGAGTVTDVATVAAVADAGARFVVAPNVDPGVIGAALDAGLAPLPGALTATEVAAALAAGAEMIKLFPAGPMGTAYLRALRGPFEHVAFVPTGGIAHDAAGDWIAAGASAVGLGSDLVGARPADADLEGIEARARVAVASARAALAASSRLAIHMGDGAEPGA